MKTRTSKALGAAVGSRRSRCRCRWRSTPMRNPNRRRRSRGEPAPRSRGLTATRSGSAQLEDAGRPAGQPGAGADPGHQHLQLRGLGSAEPRRQHRRRCSTTARTWCSRRPTRRSRSCRPSSSRRSRPIPSADGPGLLPRLPRPARPRRREGPAAHPAGRRDQGRGHQRRHQGQRHRQGDLRWHPGPECADLPDRHGARPGAPPEALTPSPNRRPAPRRRRPPTTPLPANARADAADRLTAKTRFRRATGPDRGR